MSTWVRGDGERNFQVLWQDGERVFCSAWRRDADGSRRDVLAVLPAAEHPTAATLERLAHEYGLKDLLEGSWATRPLEFVCDRGQTMLVLEDADSAPLERLLGAPMEVGRFLHLAIGIAAALGQAHRAGLVHKDVKPANILVSRAGDEIRLTGFGIASRLPRERQAPGPPETIAGTLAYMAPEQTGRMNRSVDARSDLYALGVTLYQMLTGVLPFTAADPMEWVHCHIARKPAPPAERLATVPASVSAIVMKLLAKTAEERYQTASGVERDLRRCLAAWEAGRRIDEFALGDHDTPDQLLIPEKLYGRAHEVAALLAAFDRVAKGRGPELVLVSGYSGVGKSAVVNELRKMLVSPRGLFAAGKFEQYKRDIPYAPLAQALQGLIRPLLGKSDAELAPWRDLLGEALGPNGQLMVDLVPEVRLIIGDQPPVLDLPAQDAQRRFQLVFRRFVGVFARKEHPLVLFLDDLQWLDAASLDLLEELAIQPELRHLLLVGAYRANEVTAAHPLKRRLAAIRSAGGKVREIVLAPLGREDMERLIADALHSAPERVAPLAALVQEKTAGNPFFTIQFLTALAEEGLLAADHEQRRWSWDLERIRAKGYTDNVADLMLGMLRRLPAPTQEALQLLACLGNGAAIGTLAVVRGGDKAALDAALWDAVRAGLVSRLEGSYRFLHDRVQEAAYSLIPAEGRAAAHLRIGRILAAHTPPEQREEAIFEIVNQLNRGAALIDAPGEREQLAELNLIAGRRAKASIAYEAALIYLIAGRRLLAEACWEHRHELLFALELEQAECEFLTGALAEAGQRLQVLWSRAADTMERATVACLRMDLYTTLDQGSQAVSVGLDYLRHLGIDWSPHPTEREARREYERISEQLGNRTIESLITLPLMSDPISLATLAVLTRTLVPALYTDANLLALVTCRAVNLSLARGNCDASCTAYEFLGIIAGGRFGDYQQAYRFGQLGYNLVEDRGWTRSQARTYTLFGNIVQPWTKHVRAGRDLLRRAFEAANKIGDLTYATYCGNELNTNMLAAGDPLTEVQCAAERGLAFAQKARFGFVIDIISTQLGLIRTLRGLTPTFGVFDDAEFDERRIEQRFAEKPDLGLVACWYWVRKLQARFFAGDYPSAVDASARAQRLLWTCPSFFETAEYRFYSALSHAAAAEAATDGARRQHLDALMAHHRQLGIWAANCPENFENRAALVGAEIARLEGRELDAERLYEQAIRSARANGFIHNEALAYELAGRFYAQRGFETNAQAHLRNARRCYSRWGAEGKVRQLDQFHPQLGDEERAAGASGTIGVPVEHLDLATVMKVSQAVSGEIVLEKLLDTLMRTAIEQAGAERGLLVLAHGAEPRIEAEAITSGDTVIVRRPGAAMDSAALPVSVLRYVLRTREGMILDDASIENAFSADPYIRQHGARSILCLPLLNQAKLIGVLYVENNLAPGVFAPARIAMLKLLASQAAVSLENTRLYRDLEQREAKIRRLVDSNIIGIIIWEFSGRIHDANDAFLQMVGHSREDLLADRLRWTELTPPEWCGADAQAVIELKATGRAEPFEKEYYCKDGGRVPVLVGVTTFEDGGSEGVAFVLDLTERKQAESETRSSEQRYREMQMELAHANRVATLGQLTASIAHEINQPITGTIISAQAALRWLDAKPPNLREVRQALGRIVKDGSRAGQVIGRTRGLIEKAPPHEEALAINQAILEVIALLNGETVKHGVSVETRLADDLPAIHGDRVQLQQVLLNLIINAVQAMSGVTNGAREILISTGRAEPDSLFVTVLDSGPGLAPAVLERLFEPFYTTKPGGLGLGLSICRSIVEAHGGRLWANPNALHGAEFHFTLPTQPGDALTI